MGFCENFRAKFVWLCIVFLLVLSSGGLIPTVDALTVEEIIKLKEAGISEELILELIRKEKGKVTTEKEEERKGKVITDEKERLRMAEELRAAALAGQTEKVKSLLDWGAAVKAKDKEGHTALMWAAARGHTDTVKLLLNRGANINAKTNDGWIASMMVFSLGHRDIMKTLMDRGAGAIVAGKH